MAIPSIDFNLFFLILFDFASDVFEEVLGSLFEVVVHIHVVAVGMADFPEAVHVELAYKGGKVAMFEVNRENILGEFADRVNAEGIAGGCPTNYLRVVSVLPNSINTSIIS